MKKCVFCLQEMPDSSKFCPNCGKPITEEVSSLKTEEVRNNSIEIDSDQTVNANSNNVSETSKPEKKKLRFGLA